MAQPTRKTPARIARMIELHKHGASTREIADELKLGSHHTVIEWLKDAGLVPNGGSGARHSRKRVPMNGVAGGMADAHKLLAELGALPPPKDMAGVRERLLANFGLVSGLVEYHIASSKTGQSTMAELEKAINIQDKFAVKIRELTPQEAADPESDPGNAEAADAVIGRIMSTAAAARAKARCVHCGRNPHG
jgi:hypothetical protein